MQKLLYFLGIIAFSAAQFPQPGYPNIPGVAPPPWQGPIADHVNGIPPKDTPEVAAAKNALNQAYAQVLAVLPALPQESSQQGPHYVPNHHVPVQNYPVHHYPQHNPHTDHYPHHNYHPQGPTAQFPHMLAEEIPRSPIGEVPEVHAARVAHLKVYQDTLAALPRLSETTTQQPYYHVEPAHHYPYLSNSNYQQDTPEVAKAKAEHAAAVAALG